uniref:HTH CENPB-type domain-containing protein n=1 Tax=Latimeria chalumnae TaxID=7897 RepID=H3A2M1_LATCH
MEMPPVKKKVLSLADKVKVIEMLNGPKVSQREIAKQFGVSQPQICRIIKNKDEIMDEWHQNANPERKRKREGKDTLVETALLRWFENARAADIPINGLLLQLKAKKLAEALGKPDFDPNSGWLSRFKVRHNIAFKKAHGEKKDANQPAAEHWKRTVLPDLIRRYAPSEIYNCDETGLFFRATPESIMGSKKACDRLTVMLCTNLDGSEKMDLLIVGKSKNPQCFRSVNLEQMQVTYRANSNSWMTASLFTEWLRMLNKHIRQKRKKILLFLDSCSVHPHVVVSNFKSLYRKRMLTRILAPFDSGSAASVNKLSKQLTILDAIHMMVQAWREVRTETIKNCFRAAGFCPDESMEASVIETVQAPESLTQDKFEEFVGIDDRLECFGEQSDAEIVESVRADETSISEENNADDLEDMPAIPCPSKIETIECLAKLRRYLECNSASSEAFRVFYKLEDTVHLLSLA